MCIWYSNLLCYILYLVKKLFCFVFLQKILLLYLIGYYPSRGGLLWGSVGAHGQAAG